MTRARIVFVAIVAVAVAASVGAQQFVEATATRFPFPNPAEWTNQVTVGDIDNDGDLDLLFANGGNFSTAGTPLKVRIFLNTGVGFFKDETDDRTGGHTGLYRGVELGDCDRDGDLDVVLAQDFNRLPNLLVNNGSGFFTVEGATRLPAITLSSSRGQFGDVDNDGDLDLFFTSGGANRFGCGQYRLYLNDGACHYTDATLTQFPVGTVCENMDCIFGDIDNDFDLDIRTASRGTGNSRLYRNDGSGTYTIVAGVPTDSTCYSYDFGDMDGDGDLDMLGANGFNGNSAEILLQNDGTGGYLNVSSQLSPNPTGDDDNDSKFFDYDNDGDLDLIVAKLGGTAEKFYNNNGTGSFTQVSGLITPVNDSSLDVKVADLNGDGKLDIVTAQGESGNFENRIYINNGPADSIPPTIVRTESRADTFDSAGPYVVRALILDQMSSDRNFVDGGVTLRYTVDAGPLQVVSMLHSGGQVYRGQIPGQPGGSEIAYWVVAKDAVSNTTTGPVQTFQILTAFVAAGRVPDGAHAPGTPFLLSLNGSDLALDWASSCVASDSDYAVYEGTLGAFTSHVPVVCSTAGATAWTLSPGAGDRYYLVVPRNAMREGSYGLDSALAERPASAAACLPRAIAACP